MTKIWWSDEILTNEKLQLAKWRNFNWQKIQVTKNFTTSKILVNDNVHQRN